MRASKGFTLIELITVIAVVGVLLVGLLVIINPIVQFQKARDTQRRSALRDIRNALETYYNDNGSYPTTTDLWNSSDAGDTTATGVKGGAWIAGLSTTYIDRLPQDPSGGTPNNTNAACTGGTKRAYRYRSDGKEYALLANCSIEVTSSLNNPKDGYYDSVRPTYALKVCMGETGCTW